MALTKIDDYFPAIPAQQWETQNLSVQRLHESPEWAGDDRRAQVQLRGLRQSLQHVKQVTFLESHLAEVSAKLTNISIGEVRVSGVSMFAGKSPYEVYQRVVPQSLMENSPPPRRQDTEKLGSCA